ncbi:MAG: ABC transporter substrate-binding protein [Patescibacteria group bacterium]
MKKVKLFLIIIIIVIIAIMVLLYVEKKNELQMIQPLRIGYQSQGITSGPIMVAYDKGFFNKAGLQVEMIPLKSGNEIRQAIALNRIDVAFTTPTNVFMVAAIGAPVKIIAHSASVEYILYVRPDGEIKTFSDLKGKKIFGGGVGNSEVVLTFALNKEGIKSTDFEFVDAEKDYRELALVQHKIIDVIPCSRYNKGFLEKAGAIPHQEWEEKGYGDELWPISVVAVNTDYLKENNQLIESFLNVLIEAQEYITMNKNESAELIAKHINTMTGNVKKFSAKEIQDVWQDGVEYVLWYEQDKLIDMSKFVVDTGMIETKIPLETIFDLTFEEKLKFAQDKIYGSKN